MIDIVRVGSTSFPFAAAPSGDQKDLLHVTRGLVDGFEGEVLVGMNGEMGLIRTRGRENAVENWPSLVHNLGISR